MRNKRLAHLAQTKNAKKNTKRRSLFLSKMVEKAVFLGRNSNEFQLFIMRFLAALSAFDVGLI